MKHFNHSVKNNNSLGLVSVVLPTFNEKENIIDLVKVIKKVVTFKKEIIVVDDNSPDGTSQVVKKYIISSKDKNLRLETRYKNRGLTNSIKRGIKISKGDIIVWMDCDFSMPPALINKLIKKIEDGYDISVASRFIKGGGFKKDKSAKKIDSPAAIVLSRLMNFTIQFMLGRDFRDYTSGFIGVKKKVFSKVKLRGDYGEYFVDLIFKARGYKFKIVEIPYICLPRRKGESKTGQNLGQFLMRGYKYIFLAIQLLFEKYILHKIP